MVFGLWLIAPGVSFAFIALAQADESLKVILSPESEIIFGLILLHLGALDCYGVYFKKYVFLKNMHILGAAFWAFITASWLLTDPNSTAVVVYGFFTLYAIYQFHAWSLYTHDVDLRNKRNLGNI